MKKQEYIKFIGKEMKLSTYFAMQTVFMVIAAAVAVISFIAFRDQDGALSRLWIFAVIVLVGEIFETLFFSKKKRFQR